MGGCHDQFEREGIGDFALRGLVAELAESGLKVDHRAVWNLVQGEKLNFKKIAAAGERVAPTLRTTGCGGASIKIASSLSVRFSSKRPGTSSWTIMAVAKP